MIEATFGRNGNRSRPMRFAVIGVGYWGPNLVRNLHELAGAEVLWACDLRVEQLNALSRRYPALRVTTRMEDVLEDPNIDAVAVATTVSSHYSIAWAALQADKHVIIEKPLAASSDEAEALCIEAARRQLILMPGHTFLYSPPVNLIRELILSGELGDIYFISTSRVNLGLHQPDVSVAWDLAPHDFSILRYWLQEMPTHITALSRECIVPGIPDVAFINLEFASSAIAHVQLSWLAPSKLRRTTIVGSRKMVVYDDNGIEPVRIFDSGVLFEDPKTFGEYKLSYRTGDILSPHVDPSEPLSLELDDFCHSIRTRQLPRSHAQIGLDVVRMVEATELSIATNSRVCTDGLSAEESGKSHSCNGRSGPEQSNGGRGAIDPTVAGSGVEVAESAVVYPGTILGEGCKILDGAVVGKQPTLSPRSSTKRERLGPTEIGPGVVVSTGAVVFAGTQIGPRVIVGDQSCVRERVTVGEDVVIGRGVLIDNDTTIGARTRIQANAYITNYSTVEEDVFIAPGVQTTNDNFMGRTDKRHELMKGPTIRRGARVGGAAVLCPAVEIGAEAFVGAGAVVTKDVPAKKVVVGNPARVLRDVPSEELLDATEQPLHLDMVGGSTEHGTTRRPLAFSRPVEENGRK